MGLHGMAHSFIELHKPLHHNNAVIHEGEGLILTTPISISCVYLNLHPTFEPRACCLPFFVFFPTALGLRYCTSFSLVVVSRGSRMDGTAHGLIVAASPVAEHTLWGRWAQ